MSLGYPVSLSKILDGNILNDESDVVNKHGLTEGPPGAHAQIRQSLPPTIRRTVHHTSRRSFRAKFRTLRRACSPPRSPRKLRRRVQGSSPLTSPSSDPSVSPSSCLRWIPLALHHPRLRRNPAPIRAPRLRSLRLLFPPESRHESRVPSTSPSVDPSESPAKRVLLVASLIESIKQSLGDTFDESINQSVHKSIDGAFSKSVHRSFVCAFNFQRAISMLVIPSSRAASKLSRKQAYLEEDFPTLADSFLYFEMVGLPIPQHL